MASRLVSGHPPTGLSWPPEIELVGYRGPNPAQLWREISAAPLRQADLHAVGEYAHRSLRHLGDLPCLKHFLPRVTENAYRCCGSVTYLAPRFRASSLPDWPSADRQAVEEFLLAGLEAMLTSFPAQCSSSTHG